MRKPLFYSNYRVLLTKFHDDGIINLQKFTFSTKIKEMFVCTKILAAKLKV